MINWYYFVLKFIIDENNRASVSNITIEDTFSNIEFTNFINKTLDKLKSEIS